MYIKTKLIDTQRTDWWLPKAGGDWWRNNGLLFFFGSLNAVKENQNPPL